MHVVRITRLHGQIVDREISHEDARVGARHAVHGRSRALKAFEDDFEQLALLRVHVRGLEVIDAEEAVVKLTHVLVQEIAALNVHGAAAAAVRVVEGFAVVAFGRYRAMGRPLMHQEVPEGQGRVDGAGEAASCECEPRWNHSILVISGQGEEKGIPIPTMHGGSSCIESTLTMSLITLLLCDFLLLLDVDTPTIMGVVRITRLHGQIVDREISHEDARVGARHAVHGRSRALKAFEDDFEQLALLRVHVRGLEVIDAEEAVVKLTHVLVQEIAALNVHGAAAAAVRVVEGFAVVAFGRYRAMGRPLMHQEVPEGQGRVDGAGEAASCECEPRWNHSILVISGQGEEKGIPIPTMHGGSSCIESTLTMSLITLLLCDFLLLLDVDTPTIMGSESDMVSMSLAQLEREEVSVCLSC